MNNESPQSEGGGLASNRDVANSAHAANRDTINGTGSDSVAEQAALNERRFYARDDGGESADPQVPIDERARRKAKSWVDVAMKQQLPLQTETSFFILVNMLDFFMTFMLLNFGAIESNPLADFFYKNFGFRGMLFFKLASVAVICILAQVIAKKSMAHARFVLVGGSCIVGAVVIYSAWLLRGMIS